MIKFACSCQTVLEVSDDFAGASLQCPKCKRLVDVPTLSDLQAMTEDGTFKLDELKLHDDSNRLEDLKRAFAPGRVDELGNEIDLRQSYAGDDENIPVLQEDDVLEIVDDPRIPRKYDPVTGELIRELDLQTEEAKFDPSTIPMAKAVINYASGVTKNEFSGWRIVPELGKFSNIFVMGIILFVHFFLQFMMFPMVIGMLMILPGFFILCCLMLAHYANVIEDIGVERNDELPRPLRNVSLYDDMWKPFLNMTTALLVCYGPILFAHRFPFTASLAYIGTILVLGTIAFPAVLLTTTTSGTILNLAPDKLLRVISAMGVRYLIAVVLWIVTAGVYFIGIMGTMLALAALFTAIKGTFWGLGVPVVIAYALLFIGVVLMHGFCWYLGLQYRRHNEDFDWYLQRHYRKVEMIKSPTGIMVPAPNKPIAPLKPPLKSSGKPPPIPPKNKPTPVQALPPNQYPQSHA